MSESPKCCARLPGRLSFSTVPCKNTGSLEHEGKHYCKIHHPPTVKAKDDARLKDWEDRFERESLARQRKYHEASEVARKAAEYDTLLALNAELVERLQWMVDLMPDPELDTDHVQAREVKKAIAALAKAEQARTELPK